MKPLVARLAGPFADLPAPVWALFASNVVNYAGNFVWPLLTLMLTERLGMSPDRASVYLAISVGAWLPGTALGGKLADHFGRKRVLVLSRAVAALLLLPCALVGPSPALVWLILASRFVTSMGEPAVAAMAADLATGPRRAASVSLLYLGLNLGFAVGPMVAGFLYRSHLGWIFVGDALTTLLSVAVVARLVPETLPSTQAATGPAAERPVAGSLWAVARQRPQLLPLGVALLLFSIAYSQVLFSLPLHAVRLLGEDGPKAYGLAMSTNGLAIVLVTPLLARLAQRASPATWVALGGAFYAVGFGAVGLVAGVPGLIATTVVWSVGEVLVATNWRVHVADQSPSSHRARLSALMQSFFGAGFVAGPLLGARLIDRFGTSAVWPGCLIVSAAGVAVLGGWLARERIAARVGG